MAQVTEDRIRAALSLVRFPGLPRDIVSFGLVESITICGAAVALRLNVPSGSAEAVDQIARESRSVIEAIGGIESVKLDVVAPISAQPGGARQAAAVPGAAGGAKPHPGGSPLAGPPGGQPGPGSLGSPGARPGPVINRAPIDGVSRVIAVASGKGGVGKSTVAVNLAAALGQLGEKVGLMDADIYGPSVPTMLGTHEEPEISELEGRRVIVPIHKFGMQLMSLGFVQPEDEPVIWRGPLIMKAIRQFLRDVDWRGAETLIIDLPPGTGDAQLTLTQSAPLDGAVIVTTPQDVALIDARKGLAMFQEVDVPVLGIVENMSVYHCPSCGHEAHIFRKDGGRRTAADLDVPFLGAIPIDPSIAEAGDAGTPYVISHPDSPTALAFREIAARVFASVTDRGTEVVN